MGAPSQGASLLASAYPRSTHERNLFMSQPTAPTLSTSCSLKATDLVNCLRQRRTRNQRLCLALMINCCLLLRRSPMIFHCFILSDLCSHDSFGAGSFVVARFGPRLFRRFGKNLLFRWYSSLNRNMYVYINRGIT